MKIDELDKKLLILLAKEGRMTSAEMAKIVGAHERTVVNRVNNLIRSAIVSIIGVINHEHFGYRVTADIFCEVEVGNLDEISRKIAEFPEVRYVAIAFGERDISVQVVSKSTAELYEFVSNKLARLPGIKRTNTVIVPKVIKDIHEWLPPEFNLIADSIMDAQKLKDP